MKSAMLAGMGSLMLSCILIFGGCGGKKTASSAAVKSAGDLSAAVQTVSGGGQTVSGEDGDQALPSETQTPGTGGEGAARPAGKEAPASDFQYALNNAGDGIKIIRYKGKGGNVIIPAEIEGVPVTQLGDGNVQSKAVFDNSGITSLVIPDSIRDLGIGLRASQGMNSIFYKENSLTTVVLPNGIKEIPAAFFLKCEALKSVNIPGTVRIIEMQAFEGTGLTSVVIPEGVRRIDESAFARCKNLESITLPNTLQYVSGMAFGQNGRLKTVNLPSNPHLTEFSDDVFYGCSFSIATQSALKKARDTADYRSTHPDEFPKWEEEFGKRVMKPFKHYFGADGEFYVPIKEGEQYDGEIFMREVIEEE